MKVKKAIKTFILNDNSVDYTARYGWQAAFGDSTFKFGYISSYKDAADELVDLTTPDLYVFPIMFCYRQYLELVLKNICEEAMNEKAYEHFIRDVSHRLSKVWYYSKKELEEKLSKEEMDFIEGVVLFFDEIDPRSYTFRYEKDLKLNKTIKEPLLTINTLNLKKCVDKVDSYLRWTYDY